ncbi:MAG TPA: TlyA family RNA methyltransferase [Bacillota bacterium]|nr:TlyA family RNA methyltransferase [Bacillota bacterium]
MSKVRLDVLLVDKGLFPSREKAKGAIMAGTVYISGQKVDKAGTLIPEEAAISIKEDACPYVSRGGLKLEKAFTTFSFPLLDKVCMDIGASTGGFTDFMLKHGARKVYCVDVGYGQLDYRLRNDHRVINMERTNIRYVKPEDIPEPMDFISIDVSFISLELVLPVAYQLLKNEGQLVCLIKPQFEAGKEQVGKGGIVKDVHIHEKVIQKVIDTATEEGFRVEGLTYSPVKGAKGNIEYLLWLRKTETKWVNTVLVSIEDIIEQAKDNLR